MAELGSDIAGVFDLTPTLEIATGRQALAEAILRRLFTPRGGLIGAPTYGYGLFQLIGSTVPSSIIEQRVLEQVRLEEEVEDARVTVTRADATSALTVDIAVIADDGPFQLTIAVSSELTAQAFIDGELFASNDNASTAAA